VEEKALLPIDANGLARCLGGELVYEPDLSTLDFPFPRRMTQGGLRAAVLAPLRVEGRVFGVLVAARAAAESFSSGECEFLRHLSEHVALAANQARLHGELQQAYDDLRRTQQAIMQQERLRALGQMASGIAHDINNAISPVALYTESLLERETGISPRGRQYLQTIQQSIDDVTATVARMREFYRQREGEAATASLSLNKMLQQVLDLTEVRWRDMPQQRGIMIRLQMEFATELPLVQGVENEIRDAFTNLILNAVDAMPSDGTLTVRTRLAPPHNGDAVPTVVAEVSDTGIGMDDETRRRCLEPFYTTKGERGTGLGLAMVYGMVQRHGAVVEIDSTPGQGTTVRLVFPIAGADAATAKPLAGPAEPLPPLRLLLVDDDPLLIRSLRDTLEGEGLSISSADGGEAGIEAFTAAQASGWRFDAVITDLGMPYVDGRKVAAAVKAASPETPVILLTGWGQRMVADGEIPPNVDQVLSKPPKVRDITAALRAVLGLR
jgi:signal transduction histidine kinase